MNADEGGASTWSLELVLPGVLQGCPAGRRELQRTWRTARSSPVQRCPDAPGLGPARTALPGAPGTVPTQAVSNLVISLC